MPEEVQQTVLFRRLSPQSADPSATLRSSFEALGIIESSGGPVNEHSAGERQRLEELIDQTLHSLPPGETRRALQLASELWRERGVYPGVFSLSQSFRRAVGAELVADLERHNKEAAAIVTGCALVDAYLANPYEARLVAYPSEILVEAGLGECDAPEQEEDFLLRASAVAALVAVNMIKILTGSGVVPNRPVRVGPHLDIAVLED